MSDTTEGIERALVAWEGAARAATPGPWESAVETAQDDMPPDYAIWMPAVGHDGALVEVEADADHIAANDPAAVLRMVAGIRAVVSLHPEMLGWCQGCAHESWPCRTLLALAAMFAPAAESGESA